MSKHPIQPLVKDEQGVVRFQGNAIVRYLLDNGGIDMNKLACLPFSGEDREQFAQLIGYSHSGASELGYMTDDVLDAAWAAHENSTTPEGELAKVRQAKLDDLRDALREPIASLFGIHPDDLRRQ